MSYDDQRESSHGFSRARSVLHISMGVVYLILGCFVLYLQRFGGLALPGVLAYLVGGLMLLYGGFRIWRGWRDMQERKSED